MVLGLLWQSFCFGEELIYFDELGSEVLNEIMLEEGTSLAVFFPKGAKVPLSLFFQGNVVHLHSNDGGYLELLQDLCVKISNKGFEFSDDGDEWKNWSNYFTGTVQCSLGGSDNGAIVTFESEVNKR